ncbi:hypothetical protein [Sphingomonas cavernae]|uniref:Uncharacterized protein n=1 Tax=Sphingomonas cavernae TaxID=2320861 RepID=A0A418WMB3_9SPHN|nr:hypothetical protein [Sphingomonas cavernae]RJF91138.1 hypothetical protein D3876_13480 [Sphingomonas cavernae]
MANLIIVPPAPIAAIVASRGTGAANLLTSSPKEVWVDIAVGSAVNIDIDLGAARSIDTVLLGHIHGPAPGAVWTITGGVAAYAETVLKASGPLRAADAAGQQPSLSHALWHGAATDVRYLRLSITQPAGAPMLMAGIALVGAAFTPALNKEWGSGRRPIDNSTVTPLPDGGFAVVEGARKMGFAWTFGDLSDAEADRLQAVALDVGESRPVLVVEDPAPTTGLRNRIHYGLFEKLRQFERRNRIQTRWEFGMEEWV